MAIVGLLLAFLILVLTVPDVPLGQINAFIPMIDACTSLVDLIIATLLYRPGLRLSLARTGRPRHRLCLHRTDSPLRHTR